MCILPLYLQVENFTVTFSDGRILCHLIHHYHPGLLPEEAVSHSTTQTMECSLRGRLELSCSASDSDSSFDSVPPGLNGMSAWCLSVHVSNWMLFGNNRKHCLCRMSVQKMRRVRREKARGKKDKRNERKRFPLPACPCTVKIDRLKVLHMYVCMYLKNCDASIQ